MSCWIHRWNTIKDTVLHQYQQCSKCGQRRILDLRVHGDGYQPIDYDWVATGRFVTPESIMNPEEQD
jgi:hypothetical protein